MEERNVTIPTADGSASGYLYVDDSGGQKPGVVFYTDIFGIRQANRDMASRLCSDGYTVLLPNVFYRTMEPPIIDRNAPDEQIRERFGEIRAPLTNEALFRDARSYVDFLADEKSVAQGRMGAVGYCFTGKLALYTAAVRPDRVAAAASFHGGGLYTEEDDSPHAVLPKVEAALYFGHAFEDRSMPAESIEKLEEALESWGGEYESETYREASHGWTVPDSQAYHHEAAERAYGKLLSLFRRAL